MTALDLARRLVAAPQWPEHTGAMWMVVRAGVSIPKLDDPATAGILLAMLVEPDEVDVQVDSGTPWCDGWRVVTHTYAGDQLGGYLEREYEAPSLGEAVAKALLEVWGE